MAIRSEDILIDGKPYVLVEGSDAYLIDVATPFAPKVVTGDYSYEDFTNYSVLSQTDLRGGAGQEQIGDALLYAWAERVDTRSERTTLGSKVDTSQRSRMDGAGTLGVHHVPGNALNSVSAMEVGESSIEWLTLGLNILRAGGMFMAPTVVPGEPAPDIPDLLLHFDANVGVDVDDVGYVDGWLDLAGHNDLLPMGPRPRFVEAAAGALPMVQGDGGTMRAQTDMPWYAARTLFIALKVPSGMTPGALFSYGDWAFTDYSQQYFMPDAHLVASQAEKGGLQWSEPVDEDRVVIITLKQFHDKYFRLWYDSILQDDPAGYWDAIGGNGTFNLFSAGHYTSTDAKPSEVLVGEVMLYSRELNPDERWLVEEYMRRKWITGVQNDVAIAAPSYQLETAWLYMRRRRTQEMEPVRVQVWTSTGLLPDQKIGEGTLNLDDIKPQGGWVQVRFDAVVTLEAGQRYVLVVDAYDLRASESIDWLVGGDVYGHGRGGLVYLNVSGEYTVDSTRMPFFWAQYPDIKPDSRPVKFVEYRGEGESPYVYALAGRRMYRIISTRNIAVVNDSGSPKVFDADITDGLVVVRDWAVSPDVTPRLLLAFGPGSNMWEWSGSYAGGGGGFTEIEWDAHRLMYHDLTYWRASFDEERGWFVQGSYNYDDWETGTGEGIAGEWTIVGDSRYPVNALFEWKGQIYAGKPDGLYLLTPEGGYPGSGKLLVTRQIDLASEVSDNTFMAWAVWKDDLFFSLGHGVAKLTSGNVLSSIGPGRGLGPGGYTRGRFVSFHATLTQLYAVYEGQAGQWSSLWAYSNGWSNIATSGRLNDQAGAVFVDSGLYGEYPRIWMAWSGIIANSQQPTESLLRWSYVNPDLHDANPIRYYDRSCGAWFPDTPGILVTSWYASKMETIPKSWTLLDIGAEVGPEQRIEVYYRTDPDGQFALIGSVTHGPVQRLVFPEPVVSAEIQLMFKLYTNQSWVTPTLNGYALRYVERPDLSERVQVSVLLADCLEMANGAKDMRTMAEQYADLLEARRSQTPIRVVLLDGRELWVDIVAMNGSVARRYEYNQTKLDLVKVVRLSMLEVPHA